MPAALVFSLLVSGLDMALAKVRRRNEPVILSEVSSAGEGGGETRSPKKSGGISMRRSRLVSLRQNESPLG
jgi:hypothetical protein